MRSRCFARQSSLDPLHFRFNRDKNSPGFTLPECDSPDVRRSKPDFASNTSEDSCVSSSSEHIDLGSGILESHNLAVVQPQLFNRGLKLESSKKGGPEYGSKSHLPEWAKLMESLQISVTADRRIFAAKLNVTQVTVSNWLTGKKEPRPEIYFRISRIWPDAPEVPLLLKRAADVSGLYQVRGFDDLIEKNKNSTDTRTKGYATSIPLLKHQSALGTSRQTNEKEIQEELIFPVSFCPNPEHTVCVKFIGDSMSPIIDDGYIIAIDTAQNKRERLYNHMIAARSPEGHIHIKWLRKAGKEDLLVPQNTGKRHQSEIFPPEDDQSGWKIIGKVLFWIGTPG